MNERQYLKRFNQGYGLMAYQPELEQRLKDGIEKKQTQSDQDKALMAGMDQMEKEMNAPEKYLGNYKIPKNYGKKDMDQDKSRGIEKD